VLWTTFMFGAAVNSMFTFVAPFADAAGRGPVGGFFLTYAFSAVSVRVLTGRLPDRVGLYRVLIPALAGYGLGVLCVPHTGGALALTGIGVLCGIGHGYAFPILNVLTVDRVAPRFRGRAVSWFTAMFDLGNTLANPLLGAVAEMCGYRVMFAVAGCGVLFTAAAVWRNGPPPRPYGDQAAR